MESNQTAVQWLIDKLSNIKAEDFNSTLEVRLIIQQAKTMEREQIMMAVKDSWYMAKGSNFQAPQEEQYYNETYGAQTP